jgi:branched-chain amino acid transport system substrate-binding protein
MKPLYRLILTLLILSLVLVSCAAPAEEAPAVEEDTTEEEAAAEEEMAEEPMEVPEAINIGAVIPLTGPFAGGGAQVERGYQYGVEDINAAGGIYVAEYDAQIPINLIVMDDESNADNTVSALEAMYANDDVTAYLGGFGSNLHAAAAAIAEKNQVPYLGVAFAFYDIHQQGYQYLFSPFWKSPEISTEVFEMLNALLPEGERPTRVAILQEQSDWGIELGGLWEAAAADYGYEVVAYEEYAIGTADFTDIILRIQAADAQTVLALPIPPDGYTMFRQMGELGFTPEFSFIIRAPDNTPGWVENLGAVGEFVTLGPGWHNSLDYEGVDAINERHVEEIGIPALPQVGNAYAVIQILADAIERAGSLDRAAIREALSATDLDTVAGHVTFNADGTSSLSSPIVQIVGGAQVLVWPSEFATSDLVFPAPPFEER